MSTFFSSAQTAAINQDNRQTAAAIEGGLPQVLEDIKSDIASGAIGITANAWDVDALAKDARNFAHDADTTAGLTLGYRAGRLQNGKAIIDVAAGTVALSASTTNYVEASRAGVVSKNTVGFTAGSIPLFVAVTGVAAIATLTHYKVPLFTVPGGGFTSDMLSAAAAAKATQDRGGTINATAASALVFRAPVAGVITSLSVWVETTLASSDVNYWTFSAVNKGPTGGGATAVLAASDANTTKATGGSGLTNFLSRDLTLHGTGAQLVVAQGDLIVVVATKTAAAPDLVTLRGQLVVTPTT